MKASMTLKPLVFAVAAAMAITAQAGQRNHHHYNSPLLDRHAGDATADVKRDQYIGGGTQVTNEGTRNSVDMTDTLSDNEGNVGANIAAGSMNQQVNDVAIATADEDFVFGSARAEIDVDQENRDGMVKFSGSNAIGTDGMGNGVSGNLGVNIASGDLNQQANALAIATARGWEATARVEGDQDLSGARVHNEAAGVKYVTSMEVTKDSSKYHAARGAMSSESQWAKDYQSESAHSRESSGSFSAHYDSASTSSRNYTADMNASIDKDYSSTASSSWGKTLDVDADVHLLVDVDRNRFRGPDLHADAELNVDVDASGTWNRERAAESSASIVASLDKSSSYSGSDTHDMNKNFTADYSASEDSSMSASGSRSSSKAFRKAYEEVDSSRLATSATFVKARFFIDPVTNTVSMNNSLNDISGNLGANVAAGAGNQQLNTMTIAAGCNACATGNNDR